MSEMFWKENEGNRYHDRNATEIMSATAFLEKALERADDFGSVVEFGAGTGANLEAVRRIFSGRFFRANVLGVEINEMACRKAKVVMLNKSVYELPDTPKIRADLVLTKGFLIHIDPERLSEVYEKIYKTSNKYILLAEYFSPRLESVEYRGEVLWKRDFCGELMGLHPDLILLDYGFVYKGDSSYSEDNIHYWLLEKVKANGR